MAKKNEKHTKKSSIRKICKEKLPTSQDDTNTSGAFDRKQNEEFGNFLVANNDIDTGDLILTSVPYASTEYVSCTDIRKCFNCGKAEERKIECDHCINVWFCSTTCSKNQTHKELCKKLYSRSDCQLVRLITETIKVATQNDVQSVLNYFRDAEKIQPEYAFILKLKGLTVENTRLIAKRATYLIKKLPQFKTLPINVDRIIFHLAYRHAASFPLNAFADQQAVSNNITKHRYSIHGILSWFNHSCIPNVDHFIEDDGSTYCKAKYPIKKGQQLYINYFSELKFTNEERKKYLYKTFHFVCKCNKCVMSQFK